jgi:hypothetical protein
MGPDYGARQLGSCLGHQPIRGSETSSEKTLNMEFREYQFEEAPNYRHTISYLKFLKPKRSENRKFFHGGCLHTKARVWAKHA